MRTNTPTSCVLTLFVDEQVDLVRIVTDNDFCVIGVNPGETGHTLDQAMAYILTLLMQTKRAVKPLEPAIFVFLLGKEISDRERMTDLELTREVASAGAIFFPGPDGRLARILESHTQDLGSALRVWIDEILKEQYKNK